MKFHNYIFYMYNTSLQFDLTGSSCPTFSYNEHLQIYNHMEEAYHSPAPVSMYCILSSLNCHILSLLRCEETYILAPCNYGQCSD